MKKEIALIVAGIILIIGGITALVIISRNNEAEEVVEKQEKGKSSDNKENKKEDKKTEEKKDNEDKKDNEKKEEDNRKKLPNLTGMTVEEATKKLNNENISSQYTIMRTDSDLKNGLIVRTEPEAGTPIEGTIELVFYLSNGKKGFVVEDYEGRDYKEVKSYLEARGIKVSMEMRKPQYEREDVPEGMIIGQSVQAGKELKAGDGIVLYVPFVDVEYPNFTNGKYTEADVRKFCDEYGIKLTVLYDEVTTYEDGIVFYQDGCMPGDKVVSGCEMTIKVAQH